MDNITYKINSKNRTKVIKNTLILKKILQHGE